MQEADRTAREIRLAAVPDGLPEPADLAIAEAPVPAPGRDEVLVRNRYFTVFAALRTLLGGGAQGTPLPGLSPGARGPRVSYDGINACLGFVW